MSILNFKNFQDKNINENSGAKIVPEFINKVLSQAVAVKNSKSSDNISVNPANSDKSETSFKNIKAIDLFLATKMGQDLETTVLRDPELMKTMAGFGIVFSDSPSTVEEIEALIARNGDEKTVDANIKSLEELSKDEKAVIKPDYKLLPQSAEYTFKHKEDITWDSLYKALEERGYAKEMEWDSYNFVAIRNTLEQKQKSLNHFIDLFILMSPKKDKKIFTFQGTTVPGVFYLARPFRNWYVASGAADSINPKGLAILQPGLYKYKVGIHKGYKALIQDGSVNINRFQPIDDPIKCTYKTFSPGAESNGYFGINVHRGKKYDSTPTIDSYSAGCLVFKRSSGLRSVINKLSAARQSKIKLALIEAKDLPK